MPFSLYNLRYDEPERESRRPRAIEVFEYLMDHIHEVPVHVLPCIAFRPPGGDDASVFLDSSIWSSVLPAAWSFMLAARCRGLVSSFSTVHLQFEKEAADIVGIPYPDVMQAALLPVAYPVGGTDFRPAYRLPVERITHWDSW
jgi:nitroreductase